MTAITDIRKIKELEEESNLLVTKNLVKVLNNILAKRSGNEDYIELVCPKILDEEFKLLIKHYLEESLRFICQTSYSKLDDLQIIRDDSEINQKYALVEYLTVQSLNLDIEINPVKNEKVKVEKILLRTSIDVSL